ncbi:glucose-1-phosphate cytidylyltransferase [Polynucleobacter sp. AP-Feld-500C-C5]|uniref:glucose-1-phosphate cytidylyltransferase n=1 Tax=Polynucleobacter sp. AP-Feld-500C-C5 TaxID=2576924 RepID=UPI001C0B6A2E|nr:glucose-1-phosphate cytidylyltransferase [Polynucleobacter sp. AP-Feld-500C-C5]MBU3632890.1 glucose-1-phosphate cytidylyltransferase [Polynucleobacter sp. AP-Feld-500C-C5]
MKAVILAGGLGTRISEETHLRPKPMVEVGGKPLLWHIMKIYSYYGVTDFIVCCGYKGYVIKEYFANYALHTSDVTFNLKDNSLKVHHRQTEPWSITLVDTGELTQTGGRLKRVKQYLDNQEPFCMTYGDGLSNVNIVELINFHKARGKLATVCSVMPPGRYGALVIDGDTVLEFNEKPKGDGARINGGFFVLSPEIFNYIDGDESVFEAEVINKIVKVGELTAFKHNGFWQSMDTLREKLLLEKLWQHSHCPWKLWE